MRRLRRTKPTLYGAEAKLFDTFVALHVRYHSACDRAARDALAQGVTMQRVIDIGREALSYVAPPEVESRFRFALACLADPDHPCTPPASKP